jgi:hypothetical protein
MNLENPVTQEHGEDTPNAQILRGHPSIDNRRLIAVRLGTKGLFMEDTTNKGNIPNAVMTTTIHQVEPNVDLPVMTRASFSGSVLVSSSCWQAR